MVRNNTISKKIIKDVEISKKNPPAIVSKHSQTTKSGFSIGGIYLGDNKGFSTQPKGSKFRYPVERLSAFLNVNADNIEDIKLFCQQYRFISSSLPINKTNFKKDQDDILKCASILSQNDPKIEEVENVLKIINKNLENIHPKLSFVSLGKIKQINGIPDVEIGQRSWKDFVAIKTEKHSGLLTMMWNDLSYLLLGRHNLRNCKNCGNFFTYGSRAHQKQYCSEVCKDRLKSRKHWHKVSKYKKKK